jgi:hypothetical protein
MNGGGDTQMMRTEARVRSCEQSEAYPEGRPDAYVASEPGTEASFLRTCGSVLRRKAEHIHGDSACAACVRQLAKLPEAVLTEIPPAQSCSRPVAAPRL